MERSCLQFNLLCWCRFRFHIENYYTKTTKRWVDCSGLRWEVTGWGLLIEYLLGASRCGAVRQGTVQWHELVCGCLSGGMQPPFTTEHFSECIYYAIQILIFLQVCKKNYYSAFIVVTRTRKTAAAAACRMLRFHDLHNKIAKLQMGPHSCYIFMCRYRF